jgi:hypothetical protein
MTNVPRRGLIWAAVSTRKQTAEDKHSLPIQVAEARAFFAREGIEVIDVLMVPGHSRRYKDFNELALRAAAKGVTAFQKLEAYWRAGTFDVLWVRGGDRFARTQSLHARITEEVIDANAVIYSSEDGWVDRQNYRMWTAIGGMNAAGNVDKLVAYGRKVKDQKAALGLCINSRVWWSHKVIRDEYGKIKDVVPDESKRLIIEDAARLLLEGVSWHDIQPELQRRFGHTNGGKPFSGHFFYHLFHNPHFYGNSARRWRNQHGPNGMGRWDMWIFDPAEPAPPGTLIFYDTHEPGLKEPLLSLVKAEVRRRRSAVRGGSRPHRTKMFSGLLLCGYCGYAMVWMHNGAGVAYWRCAAGSNPKTHARVCQGQHIREDAIIERLSHWLALMIEKHSPLVDLDGNLPLPQDDTAALEQRIEEVSARARRLIEKQASADNSLSALYDEQIQAAADELKLLRARLQNEQRGSQAHMRADMDAALQEVALCEPREAFWQKPTVEINTLLHRIAGTRRLWCLDKEINDIVERV